MDKKPEEKRTTKDGRLLPTPPLMNKAEWLRRSETKVTLSKGDLDQMAQLIAIGRQVLRDSRPISSKLKAAMTRLGVSTHGL
jgi:hypothetical protein